MHLFSKKNTNNQHFQQRSLRFKDFVFESQLCVFFAPAASGLLMIITPGSLRAGDLFLRFGYQICWADLLSGQWIHGTYSHHLFMERKIEIWTFHLQGNYEFQTVNLQGWFEPGRLVSQFWCAQSYAWFVGWKKKTCWWIPWWFLEGKYQS